MALKALVKVGKISNLSDARYCAGMGVDMLGFRALDSQQDHISPKLFQDIRGWVTGPKIIAEIYGITSADDLQNVIQNYAPDYLELSWPEYLIVGASLTLPCIIKAEPADLIFITKNQNIHYILIAENQINEALNIYNGDMPLLVELISKDALDSILERKHVKGISLSGSTEIRPGFKEYDALSEVLEALDEY